MNRSLLLILFISLFPACPPSPVAPSPEADVDDITITDASNVGDSGDDLDPLTRDACVSAEKKLLALGCKDSRGRLLGGANLHGVSWADICRENKANGVDMHPSCIATKKSCDEVSSCR